MYSRVPRRVLVVPAALLVVCGLAVACDSAPVNPDNLGWVTTLVDSITAPWSVAFATL